MTGFVFQGHIVNFFLLNFLIVIVLQKVCNGPG